MADDSYLGQVLGWLKGDTGPKTTVDLAPPLSTYPSNDDADFARKYGFGYGSGNEPFLNNEKARVIGSSVPFYQMPASKKPTSQMFIPDSAAGTNLSEVANFANMPNKSSVLDLTAPVNKGMQGTLNNVMMKAALAANRIPMASVGFDPERVAVDTVIHDPSILGIYSPKSDAMYSAIDPTDAVTHESIHRGIQHLRNTYPTEMQPIDKRLSNEEMTVRYLMNTQGGDPEKGSGDLGDAQRQHAINQFSNSVSGDDYKKSLNDLQELAIRYKKERNPRGPH